MDDQGKNPEREIPFTRECSDLARFDARRQFLNILDKECRGVQNELLEIWANFKERLPAAVRDQADPLSYFPNWYQTALMAKDPLALELKETLTEWAVRHGLECGWMSEVVVHTLSAWVIDPRLEESRRWFLPSPIDSHPMTYGEQVIEFSTDWDPFTTSRKKAKKEITADFKADLEQQMGEIEARSKERGIPEIPEKRKLPKHLRWLVQYQVLKHSFSAIARDAGLKFAEEQGHKTVVPAVRSAAQVIGLQPLRENDPGGRPPTS